MADETTPVTPTPVAMSLNINTAQVAPPGCTGVEHTPTIVIRYPNLDDYPQGVPPGHGLIQVDVYGNGGSGKVAASEYLHALSSLTQRVSDVLHGVAHEDGLPHVEGMN